MPSLRLKKSYLLIAAAFFLGGRAGPSVPMEPSGARREGEDISAAPRLISLPEVPFGFVGVILGFYIHGLPLSFMALLGVVGLAGVVVNDSIVLVEFINKLRREGHDRRPSIIQGCRLRLRPVLLTTITTVLGLISVAYMIGGGDPFIRPAAMAIVWGLSFATLLTLILIPCIYAIVDDIALRILHRGTVREPDRQWTTD